MRITDTILTRRSAVIVGCAIVVLCASIITIAELYRQLAAERESALWLHSDVEEGEEPMNASATDIPTPFIEPTVSVFPPVRGQADLVQMTVKRETPADCERRRIQWIEHVFQWGFGDTKSRQGFERAGGYQWDGYWAVLENATKTLGPQRVSGEELLYRAYPQECSTYLFEAVARRRTNPQLEPDITEILSAMGILARYEQSPELRSFLQRAVIGVNPVSGKKRSWESIREPALAALSYFPGMIEWHILSNYSCSEAETTYRNERGKTASLLAYQASPDAAAQVFETHLATCPYCLEHEDSEFHKSYSEFTERQATEQAALDRAPALLAAPWAAMASDEGQKELRALLVALRRGDRREYAGDLRMAIDALRADSGIPESPADIDAYRKQWVFPYDAARDAELAAAGWAGAGSKDVYLRKRRARETLDEMAWTLHLLGGPLTEWERGLLYYHRLLGDPKEHLRKLGWITWPEGMDCPPPGFQFE